MGDSGKMDGAVTSQILLQARHAVPGRERGKGRGRGRGGNGEVIEAWEIQRDGRGCNLSALVAGSPRCAPGAPALSASARRSPAAGQRCSAVAAPSAAPLTPGARSTPPPVPSARP